MNNYLRAFAFLAVAVSLFSCATILSGNKQKMLFDSFPQDAQVRINGELLGTTPLLVKVKRKVLKKQNLEISKEGFASENLRLKKDINPKAAFNILFFYGLPVDALTGAIVEYIPDYNYFQLSANDSLAQWSGWNTYMRDWGKDFHIWNKKVRLTWKFFDGMPEKHGTDMIIQTAAATASTFCYTYSISNGVLNLHSFAVFNTQRSWVKKRSKYILNHEQRHFDMSEIYSRKFKKKAMQIHFENLNPGDTLSALYQDYVKKLYAAQDKYDSETNHGMNKELQNTWNTMIDAELTESVEFEKPFYPIKFSSPK